MKSPLPKNRSQTYKLALISTIFLAVGCASVDKTEQEQQTLDGLALQVASLQTKMRESQDSLALLTDAQSTTQAAIAEQLDALNSDLAGMPRAVSKACSKPVSTVPAECQDNGQRTVLMSDDKMVVGGIETVLIDPPGVPVIARIDTGADSSSLHAENLVEFERDGEDWVRFDWNIDGSVTTLEREVIRYVRVVQQADPSGSRRPVVELRILLGDVSDTFEFTLANRSHLDYQILLGRNFLTDVAVVDVGLEFVQPQPSQGLEKQ